jgi:hypothetical protein
MPEKDTFARPTDQPPFLEYEVYSANFTQAPKMSTGSAVKRVRVRVAHAGHDWLDVTAKTVIGMSDLAELRFVVFDDDRGVPIAAFRKQCPELERYQQYPNSYSVIDRGETSAEQTDRQE